MHGLSLIQYAAVAALPLLFAITLHEVAHGWMARRLGDRTAEMLGRLSLNPIKHIDPVGTVLVPGILLFVGGFIFGWAKPVPVDARNLHNPKRDMAVVAAAGPLANLGMALIWALIAKIGLMLAAISPWASVPLILMGKVGIFLNLILMVLNLVVLSGMRPADRALHLGTTTAC
jgi:Zn-dependent protease